MTTDTRRAWRWRNRTRTWRPRLHIFAGYWHVRAINRRGRPMGFGIGPVEHWTVEQAYNRMSQALVNMGATHLHGVAR